MYSEFSVAQCALVCGYSYVYTLWLGFLVRERCLFWDEKCLVNDEDLSLPSPPSSCHVCLVRA